MNSAHTFLACQSQWEENPRISLNYTKAKAMCEELQVDHQSRASDGVVDLLLLFQRQN